VILIGGFSRESLSQQISSTESHGVLMLTSKVSLHCICKSHLVLFPTDWSIHHQPSYNSKVQNELCLQL
jgi:hypothetical protein